MAEKQNNLQEYTEIIEPSDDPLKLDAIDQEDVPFESRTD